jgi:hypothetical protein
MLAYCPNCSQRVAGTGISVSDVARPLGCSRDEGCWFETPRTRDWRGLWVMGKPEPRAGDVSRLVGVPRSEYKPLLHALSTKWI